MKVSLYLTAIVVGAATVSASKDDVVDESVLHASKSLLQGRRPRLRAETPLNQPRHLVPGNGSGPNSGPKCPVVQELGVIDLDFNPAFTKADGESACLFVSSFFSKESILPTSEAPDLVAHICDLDALEAAEDYSSVSPDVLVEGIEGTPGDLVWPNDMDIAPDGVFPFKALVVSQGFHPATDPGRLSAIDLDSKAEYIIHESTQMPPFDPTNPFDPNNSPRFYHNVLFYDMDGDGLLDIISVRSGFRVIRVPMAPPQFYPPFGELVWFKNPGDGLDPDVEWDETILVGGFGPDIFVQMADFDNNGIPEFVATHLFTGDFATFTGKISMYAAPEGSDWSDVDATNPDPVAPQARVVDLSTE